VTYTFLKSCGGAQHYFLAGATLAPPDDLAALLWCSTLLFAGGATLTPPDEFTVCFLTGTWFLVAASSCRPLGRGVYSSFSRNS